MVRFSWHSPRRISASLIVMREIGEPVVDDGGTCARIINLPLALSLMIFSRLWKQNWPSDRHALKIVPMLWSQAVTK